MEIGLGRLFIYFLASTAGVLLLGLITKWIDRKVTARVQWRVGPPWFQPFADVLKLLLKETLVPEGARRTGFLLAPIIGFAAVAVAATILCLANFAGTGFMGDTIVVLYLLTIPSLMVVLGGSASGNPHASVGASREMKLILAYELPFVLAILAVIMGMGPSRSLALAKIAGAPGAGLFPAIGTVIGFLIAILCIQAKLGFVPFDIAEAETEIMSGPYVEYSGAPLAMFYLTRAMLFATLPLFLITIFWGGVRLSGLGPLWAILKYLLIVVLLVLIRNTNPRVRIDHAVKFFWFGMTPLAVLAIALAMAA